MQGHNHIIGKRKMLGYGPVFFLQGNLIGIARQAVEVGAVETGEGLQFIQCLVLVEATRLEFDGQWCREYTGTATTGFLAIASMRCAVGTEEELGVT